MESKPPNGALTICPTRQAHTVKVDKKKWRKGQHTPTAHKSVHSTIMFGGSDPDLMAAIGAPVKLSSTTSKRTAADTPACVVVYCGLQSERPTLFACLLAGKACVRACVCACVRVCVCACVHVCVVPVPKHDQRWLHGANAQRVHYCMAHSPCCVCVLPCYM